MKDSLISLGFLNRKFYTHTTFANLLIFQKLKYLIPVNRVKSILNLRRQEGSMSKGA